MKEGVSDGGRGCDQKLRWKAGLGAGGVPPLLSREEEVGMEGAVLPPDSVHLRAFSPERELGVALQLHLWTCSHLTSNQK